MEEQKKPRRRRRNFNPDHYDYDPDHEFGKFGVRAKNLHVWAMKKIKLLGLEEHIHYMNWNKEGEKPDLMLSDEGFHIILKHISDEWKKKKPRVELQENIEGMIRKKELVAGKDYIKYETNVRGKDIKKTRYALKVSGILKLKNYKS